MSKSTSLLRASIFTKLMAISFSMVSVILVAVGSFFFVVVRPLWARIPPDQLSELQSAHDRMLLGLLVLLVAIVFAGHSLVRRMLEPLRSLGQGVTELGEGNLEIALPVRHRDELGALTEAFNQMVSRVREMVRARDQLLLDVSHELRSPLTRMKVALELCAEGEHTQRLKANVVEMESLVTELLELERLRQGRGLQLQRQDFMEVVRDAVATFEAITPGVQLESRVSELYLSIDADKIRRVLGNLLENASKYSLPDSQPVRLTVKQVTSEVIVDVVDDGLGVPADDLPNIFEPFYRVDRSRSKRTGGYGLGLSLCMRIIVAHGGTLRAKNNSRRGATFTFTLPMGLPLRNSMSPELGD